MKKMLAITLFTLATLAWAAAQQPGGTPATSSGQATSPSSQAPDASQSQPSTSGSTGQATTQSGAPSAAPGQATNAPVTEGCLGGSNPNYTITDKAGTTYKLNIPPNADTASLARHVGESVQVAGTVNDTSKTNASISVQGIGRGTGTCPGSKGAPQAPPNQ